MAERIVICSDGTWSRPDAPYPTNVVYVARAIAPVARDGWPQIVFYDAGVGTGNFWERITGGAFGWGVTKNIEDAYRFLVHNYAQGDEILFFGFSRGAYTIRSTAGLLRNSGLLRKEHADRFREAMNSHRSDVVRPDDRQASDFRTKYSHQITVKFMGVWDTVGALGIPITALNFLTYRRHKFHDTKLSRSIENAFHAVAIDEKRQPFKPTLWERQPSKTQRVEQVWSAGIHSNIGGGFSDMGLSDLALRWMVERAKECELAFDEDYLAQIMKPTYGGALYESRAGIFKYLPGYLRPIGDPSGPYDQTIDESAIQRLKERRLNYEPANLLDYLKRKEVSDDS